MYKQVYTINDNNFIEEWYTHQFLNPNYTCTLFIQIPGEWKYKLSHVVDPKVVYHSKEEALMECVKRINENIIRLHKDIVALVMEKQDK